MQEFKQYDLTIPHGLNPCDSVTPSTEVSELVGCAVHFLPPYNTIKMI